MPKTSKILLSENLFKALVQEGTDLTAILDSKGHYLYASPNHSDILGYTEKELLGKSGSDFFHPDDKNQIQTEFNKLQIDKRVKSSPYRFRKKDGSWCWLRSVGTNLIDDEAVGGIVVNSVDVTDLVATQQRLQEINERYELVNKATNDAIYDWDIENDVFYWGEGFYRKFGNLGETKIFRLKDWAKLTHPTDRERHQQSWDAFFVDKKRHRWLNTFRFKKTDGTYAYVEEIGHMIRDKQGKPKRMIGALRDISDARIAELQNQLRQQITSIFSEENSLSVILKNLLRYFIDFGEYDTAEIWILSSDGKRLNLSSTSAKEDKSASFYKNSESVKYFEIGEGLPGSVWKKTKLECWSNIEKNDAFIRKAAAKKAGLKSAVGVPLMHHGQFVGTLVLGSKNVTIESEDLALLNPLEQFLGAEIKRKQQEEESHLLFESAPEILAIASPKGYFTKVNPAFCQLMGYSKEELTLQPFTNFLHPEDVTNTQAEYEETITGERQANNFVNRYRTKSGAYKWISWSSSSVFSEDGLVFAYGRDVTEVKELQQLLKNAARLARVGSWEIDLINNTVFWSDITKEIREVDPDFKPTLTKGISGFLEGYDQDTISKKVKDCAKKGMPWDEELRIITSKGNLRWIRTIGKGEFVDGKCVKIYGSFQDINDQKLAALELEKSLKTLEDYKFSLDQSAIIAFTDNKGIITSVNDNFCKISRYSREELIGQTHRLINSKYHPKSFFKNLWETISSGNVWRGEIKNKAKDGTFYWVDTTIVPFLDKNKKPFQYLAIRFDITARKQADEAVLTILEEKNTILESIGDGFFTVDKNFTVTYWNKQAEILLQTPRGKILGKNLWSVFTDATSLPSYNNYHRALKKNETIHFEDYYEPINMWFEISVYPSPSGLSIYFKDITKRKTAEEEVRESNERFEYATQATFDAVWDWNLITNKHYLGHGFETLFGYNLDNHYVDISFWSDYIHPDEKDIVMQSLYDAIHTTTQKTWGAEYRFIKADGALAHVTDRAIILRDKKGKALRMVGAMQDVTQRKTHEESLKKLNGELAKHAKELEISNAELEQFAYVASHDLQEPLRMVTSFLTQLEKKYYDKLDTKAHQYIHFAVDGAKRMREIILDLLQFSRVGKLDEEKERIDLNELIKDYFVLRKNLIEEKSARIHKDNLPTISNYKAPITQVFHNLLDNALKYTHKNIAPKIELRVKENKTEWQFTVKDNGIGIDKEYHAKIFVIFQRLHSKSEYEGSGMGLAIVKKIIDNLDGKIWVESEIGKGSIFHFTIPK